MSAEIIIIGDAGHGDHDSGAVSHDGRVLEKTIALNVTRLVIARLAAYQVGTAMTRTNDTFLSLSERAAAANRIQAKLMSVHCNSGGGTGFECFTSPGQTPSDPWATACLEEYHTEFPQLAYRKDVQDGDPDKEARFTVLTETKGEAILFELGFVDVKDTGFLEDAANQQRMADALVRGTVKHFGLKLRTEHEPAPSTIVPEVDLLAISQCVESAEYQLKKLKGFLP